MHISKEYLPGMRIIKTSLSVLICLLIFYAFGYYSPVNAVIACVMMTKETVQESKKMSLNRILGTGIGGVTSLMMLLIMKGLDISAHDGVVPFILALSVMLDLLLCKWFRFHSYVGSMSSLVTLVTVLSHGESHLDAVTYVAVRMTETVVGIVVAYLVNSYGDFKHHH